MKESLKNIDESIRTRRDKLNILKQKLPIMKFLTNPEVIELQTEITALLINYYENSKGKE